MEAAFWILIGLGFIVFRVLLRPTNRTRTITAAVVFLACGRSDIVEVETGAWWRPWWLLVWKGSCIGILLAMALAHFKGRKDH